LPSAFCLLFFCSSASSAEPFRVYDLKVDGQVRQYLTEDLDGDGLADLVVFHTKGEGAERWLSVFYQTAAGFPPGPQRAFRVPPRAVVFDVGDLLPAPGQEIAFLARDGLYAYVLGDAPSLPLGERGSGGEGSPQKVLDVPSLFQVPSPAALAPFDFIRDLDGDGVPEVLIPQLDQGLICAKAADGHLRLVGAIAMGPVPSVRGLPAAQEAVGFGVRTGLATPRFLTLDFNADRRNDLIALYPDSLCAFFQKSDRSFGGPPDRVIDLRFDRIATGSETLREPPGEDDDRERTTVAKVADLDGDGRVDLVVQKFSAKGGIFSAETQVQVYYGRRTGGRDLFSGTPDQTLKENGVQIAAYVVDLDGDGRLDMIVPAVKLGLTQFIQMLLSKTFDVEVSLYFMGKDGRYPASPTHRRSISVQVDFKGHDSQPVYEVEDLNGDGRPDILTSADTTELEGFYGDPARTFGKRPDLRFRVKLPRNGERARAMRLNADGRADVVITYERQDEEEGENLRGIVRVLLSSAP
jgi:hypothetical protein